MRCAAFCVVLILTAALGNAQAQGAPSAALDTTALAKQSQNPVGELVSVPLQFNFHNAGDLGDRTLFNVNVQPVIPFSLSTHWNAVSRTIIPIDSVPAEPDISHSGVGDIQQQIYLTPKATRSLLWGAGLALSLPTATAASLATGSWAAGPGVVVVIMRGPFVVGGLINQLWTFADDDTDPEIDTFLTQPTVNYNFGQGWALSFSPSISADWNASPGERWTIPVGLGLTRTTVFSSRPMSLGVHYYYNVQRPSDSGASLLRFSMTLLYPMLKRG